MSYPDGNTIAPTRAARMENVPSSVEPGSKKRNGLLIGSYDPSKTLVVDDVPKEYLSSEQVGDELGWGFPLHRAAMAWEKYGEGISFYCIPQSEVGDAATGTITIAVTTVVAGTMFLYIADDPVEVGISADDTAEEIATAIKDAIDDDPNLPVTAAVATNVVTLTAKAKGTYGNYITIDTDLDAGQELQSGVVPTIVDMSGGATDPDLADAMAGLGSGDNTNSIDATDAAFGYDNTSANFTKVIDYVGITDQAIGCWAPVVARPIRFAAVDTAPGTAGYTAMKAITDAQTYNRAIAYVAAPDAYRHPFDIAAEIIGYAAAVNQANAHRSYVDAVLTGHCGDDRWTDTGSTRNTANLNGIACTKVENKVLKIDGMVTMSRPPSIPKKNNAYRSWRNISLAQNILQSEKDVWASRPSFTMVEDVAVVKPSEKPYVLDVEGVEDMGLELAVDWEELAWIYSASHTIEGQTVTVREASNGFDIKKPVIYSGEGVISDTRLETDISLSIFSQ